MRPCSPSIQEFEASLGFIVRLVLKQSKVGGKQNQNVLKSNVTFTTMVWRVRGTQCWWELAIREGAWTRSSLQSLPASHCHSLLFACFAVEPLTSVLVIADNGPNPTHHQRPKGKSWSRGGQKLGRAWPLTISHLPSAHLTSPLTRAFRVCLVTAKLIW